jgi:hypothetical protein
MSLAGIAVAAATGLHNRHALPRRHLVAALGVHRRPVDGVHAQGAVTPAEYTARGKHGAVAHAERGQRVAGIVAQHDLLAEPAAPASGATGIRDQPLRLDRRMGQRLPHLHGHEGHVGGVRQRRPAVEAFERAIASSGKVERGEGPAVAAGALHGDQVHHAGLRLHAVGRRLGERAVDERRHEMAHRMAAAGGEGRLRVEDAAWRCRHLDGRDGASIVGDIGQRQRLDSVKRHRVGVAEGHVDARADAARGAGEVERHSVASDVDLDGVAGGTLEALDVDGVGVGPLAQPADACAHGGLALAADGARQGAEVVEAVLVHEGQQLASADLVAGDVGHHVAHHLLWDAHVVANDLDQELVEPARLVELADRQPEALVVDLGGRGAEARAADIGQMRDAHRVGHEAALAEHRPHHGDVVEVAGAHPGIVGDDDVAGAQRPGRKPLQHVPQRHRRAADEDRHAEGALGDRVGLGVQHHDGEVVAFVDDGGEGGAHQRRDDLVGQRDQPVPHNAEADGVETVLAHGAHSIRWTRRAQ